MKSPKISECPECGSADLVCVSPEFFLFRCYGCNARFAEEDLIPTQEKTSLFRSRPRRAYDDDA